MERLTRIIRIITGLVFVFSGLVKGIDPLGTAYKLNDYFSAFKFSFLDDLALPLSILLCSVEFLAGLMLVTGAFTKIASWAVALFMAIFTPLTLALAIFNPVSDCGCFGDAIHLTNWQTFYKNIILTLLVVFVFIRRNDRNGTMNMKRSAVALSAFTLIFLLFVWYNLAWLPVIDFRPYRPGTSLPAAMAMPADAPADQYDVRFLYRKDGVTREFTLQDYPANDTTWVFVDQKSVLVSAGYKPPVHDFFLVTGDGTDMTEIILGNPGFTLLMIAGKLEKSNKKGIADGLSLGFEIQKQNIGFYVVTATPVEDAGAYTAGFTTLFADQTTLKTVIRANPGYLLLQNGTVMAMWSHRDVPSPDKFGGDLNALSVKSHTRRNSRLFAVCSVLTISLLFFITLPLKKKEL